LREALEVGAEASFSGFGVSASGKAKWCSERKINSYNFYLLIRVKVINPSKVIKTKQLSPNAKRELGLLQNDLQTFFNGYGDSFISAIDSGGEFDALYEFHTTSTEHKKELAGEVKASFRSIGWSGEAGADFKQKMSDLHLNAETTLRMNIEGGRGVLPKPAPEQLIKAALDFPQDVDPHLGAPIDYAIAVEDYQTAEGFPRKLKLPFEKNHRVYNPVASWRDRLLTIAADLSYAEENRTRFEITSASVTQAAIKKIDKKILDLAERIRENPTASVQLPEGIDEELDALEAKVPPQVAIEYGPLRGELKGQTFDGAKDMAVLSSRQPRTIQTFSGAILDGMDVTYKRLVKSYTVTHGGHGGGPNSFALDNEEYLTEIRFYCGPASDHFVSKMRFKTNRDRVFGPYGAHGEEPNFTLTAPRGQKIFAFYGQTEINRIRAIGLVTTAI